MSFKELYVQRIEPLLVNKNTNFLVIFGAVLGTGLCPRGFLSRAWESSSPRLPGTFQLQPWQPTSRKRRQGHRVTHRGPQRLLAVTAAPWTGRKTGWQTARAGQDLGGNSEQHSQVTGEEREARSSLKSHLVSQNV